MKVATKNQKNTSSWTFEWLLESPCSYVFKNHSSSFYCWRYVLFCCYYHNLNHYHSCHIIQYDFILNFITILCIITVLFFYLLFSLVFICYFKFNFVPFFLIVLLFAIFLKLFHAWNESIMCFIFLLSCLVLPLPALKPSERNVKTVRTIRKTQVPFACMLFKELATTTGTLTKTARKQ